MKLSLPTGRDRWKALAIVALWALVFLPQLRTNPNWYGDEGEVMEMSWTLAHGTPRVGPLLNDFIYPTPYPPFYLLVNGACLRVFGHDILVGRLLGALTALVAAGLLVGIGTRLRSRNFGFLCAAALLVYPEAVINFRWVRPHPMSGTLALASVAFLIRYVQDRRVRDLAWAGGCCALATATNYFVAPLIGAVIVTALCVNRRHVLVAAATAGSFGLLFVLWYALAETGGLGQLFTQLHRLTSMADGPPLSWCDQLIRFYRNTVTLCLLTPTVRSTGGQGVDGWLIAAALGLVCFPVPRFRKWLVFWAVALMYGVLRTRDNVPMFFYPALVFVPLFAVGFAGAIEQCGALAARAGERLAQPWLRHVPAVVALAALGWLTVQGSLVHFATKVDPWTQYSVTEAEAAAAFINQRTTAGDLVIVPKQIYWLVDKARVAMLWQTGPYNGVPNAAYPTLIPRELFWFDCRWQNAKYVVLASGIVGKQPIGIDLVYTRGLEGMTDVIRQLAEEKWPAAFVGGRGLAYAPIGDGKSWPVALEGEYVVLANPRFASPPAPAR